jgi:hypothetical protein
MHDGTSNRYVLEAVDPTTASISYEVRFHIKDLQELLAVLGLTEVQFKPGWTYYPSAAAVTRLKHHYSLNFSDDGFECALRSWHPNDDLPYKVHTGRELAMMLKQTKPLAVFCDDYPKHRDLGVIPEREFEPHVKAERIVKREHIESSSSVEPFAPPCARSTTASQAREPDRDATLPVLLCGPAEPSMSRRSVHAPHTPGFSAEEPTNPLRYPVANGNAKGIRRVLYALPGEEWRIDAYLKLWETAKKTGWTEILEREEGTLLGYEDWQNDFHMARRRAHKEAWK